MDTKESNKQLSRERAEAVRNFLVSEGKIEESRVSIFAEGENKPVASNENAAGRQQNRRVEIVVMNNQ
jgi:outer membrane protein OmpA-like peptidoglycan-associated protein